MGFGIWGVGFRAQVLEFGVQGLGFRGRVWAFGIMDRGLRLRVHDLVHTTMCPPAVRYKLLGGIWLKTSGLGPRS